MKYKCQEEPLEILKVLADSDRHSILLEGASGTGKSYLVKQFAKMKNIYDVQFVKPAVQSIKDATIGCIQSGSPVVVCIENLDTGVLAASYTLLKFLEEPYDFVYIVVTCRNLTRIPDTIISRSTVVSVSPPTRSDIEMYAKNKDISLYSSLHEKPIWNCARTFKAVDTLFNMTPEQRTYVESLSSVLNFKDNVSNIVWKLSKYGDNTDTPIDLVMSYFMSIAPTSHIRAAVMSCIKDLSFGRLGNQAVLSRFVFECKYCR